jgi:hypothetical protein
MTTRWLSMALALSALASSSAAAQATEAPGYQVHVTGMDSFADRTFVNVRQEQEPRSASYTFVTDFPIELPGRLCAVPTSMVVDSPAGGLGSRMMRGARGASGDVATDPTYVTELLAMFDAPEVACAEPFVAPAPSTAFARVVDTVHVAGVDGRTLRLELVDAQYQLQAGGPLVTVPATAGSMTRPPPPAPSAGGCACRVGVSADHEATAGVLALGVIAALARRRRARRSA